jgi:pSer/pThr/pTyr-binding forkhead associated (FHA) protein
VPSGTDELTSCGSRSGRRYTEDMNVRLEVSHNNANVKRVVLRSDTLIGRGPECNLRIASTDVSRRHCQIIVTDDAVLVRDLGSSNGTFIDGVQIDAGTDVAVAPGSQLSVGGVKFVMHFDPPALTAGDPDADAGDSTVNLPRGAGREAGDAPPPLSVAGDTVYHSPEETIRDGDRRAGAGAPGHTMAAALAEPPTEMLGSASDALVAADDELTVFEPAPGLNEREPAAPPPDSGDSESSGDDLLEFFSQFE